MKYIIPAAALQQHIIVLGKTGAGKSSAMRAGFVEPMLGDNWPVCILDPKGDWWGLKSSADGRKPGYAVVIFGGPHADVPINEHSGSHVAELFATGNRPCIIDLSDFTVGERTRFFIGFASTLYRKNRGKKWVVMDECHNFAPQGKVMDVDSGKALHWANKLASEGRGRGLNLIAASQRPQKVHKDFITSMETLIAMRVIHNLDRGAIKDWIDGCADKAIGKELLDQLATMKRGEAWIWSPEVNFGPKLIVFPMFNTYDSFKPREADAGELEGWAAVDLNDVKEKLSVLVTEAEANDPKALRKRISDLEEQLARKDFSTAFDQGALDGARRDGYEHGYRDGENKQRGLTQHKYRALRLKLRNELDLAFDELEKHGESTINVNNKLMTPDEIDRAIGWVAPERLAERMPPRKVERSTPIDRKRQRAEDEGSDLPPGERAVLSAAIQFASQGGVHRDQLTTLTGYKRSARNSYVSRLVGKDLIAQNGDGRYLPTQKGRAALPNVGPLPTGRELRKFWLERLPPGEATILDELIKAYPESINRESLNKTGYKRSARNSYLSRLSSKNLVTATGPSKVKASDNLF